MEVNTKWRRILSAIIIMLLSLAVLSSQAFATAWDGNASGTGQVGVATDKPTRYYNHYPMLWRVSLYVSTNADGKIKETDTTTEST